MTALPLERSDSCIAYLKSNPVADPTGHLRPDFKYITDVLTRLFTISKNTSKRRLFDSKLRDRQSMVWLCRRLVARPASLGCDNCLQTIPIS